MLGVVALLTAAAKIETGAARLAALVVAVPVGLGTVVSHAGANVLVPTYVLPSQLALTICAAVLIVRIRPRAVAVCAGALALDARRSSGP